MRLNGLRAILKYSAAQALQREMIGFFAEKKSEEKTEKKKTESSANTVNHNANVSAATSIRAKL